VFIDQVEGPDGKPYTQNIVVNLKVEEGKLTGNYDDLGDPFLIKGRMLTTHHVQLDCYPEKPGIVQYSTWFLRWDDDPKKMVGRFVGYGHKTQKVIYGEVTMTRPERRPKV
jgi:hypothetical protein